MRSDVLTVGHSTHSAATFLALLQRHCVTAVADVRSAPYSRFNPQFNREVLEQFLKEHGISYAFLGRELGARSGDPSCYLNGRVQYERLSRTELFKGGVERVVRGAAEYRVALLCAEKEPLDCHRTLLVSPALEQKGVDVFHILADGTLEPHQDALNRLIRMAGLPQADLLRSHEELVAEAMAIQEAKIAYVDVTLSVEGSGEAR